MKISITLFITLFSFSLLAQNRYQIDPNFQLDAVGSGARSFTVKTQSDGKILVGGSFEIVEDSELSCLVRLNADGTIDNTFNANGTGPSSNVEDIEIQPDGKILIAVRQGRYYNGQPVSSVMRLNQDGTLDNTFQVGTFLSSNFRFNNSAFALALQSDGKVIVVGEFFRIGNEEVSSIVRLNTDGSIDDTFVTGTGLGSSLNSEVSPPAGQVALLANGDIAVMGDFDTYNGNTSPALAILDTDGGFVSTPVDRLRSFIFPNMFDTEGFIIQQSDGKIIISNNINDNNLRLIRLNTDGTVDMTFNASLANESVNSIARFSDDRLLIQPTNFSSITDANGVVDATVNFGDDIDRLYLVDDNTILAEVSDGLGFTFQKYDATGTLQTFNAPSFHNVSTVNNLIKESNDSFIFAGRVSLRDGADYSDTITELGRISTDGVIDDTFTPDIDGFLTGVTLDSNNDIWVWGDIDAINGVSVSNIAKLNSDGSVDNSFNSGTGFDRRVENVKFQQDGKLVVVGDFEAYNDTTANNIIRLNPNGTIDVPYLTSEGFDRGRPEGLVLQPDGKAIVFDGNIDSYDGVATGRIVRLNMDGTLDDSFDIGEGFQNSASNGFLEIEQEAVTVLDNGQILVGGEFDGFDGHTTQGIARLNADGSVDTEFVANLSQIENYFGTVRNMVVMPNGDILVSGIFETADNMQAIGFVRLDENGGFIENFDNERDILVVGNDILIEGDTIYLTGQFKNIDGSRYSAITRFFDLTPDIADQTFTIAENSANGTVVGTIVANTSSADGLEYTIESGNDAGAFNVDMSTGEISINDSQLIDFETTPSFSLEVKVNVPEATVDATASITINLTDVDETISIEDQTFTIAENSANGTGVGTIVASANFAGTLNYIIETGNDAGAFNVDMSTGEISVADSEALDFETTPSFSLGVKVTVTDATEEATAGITINLTDVDETVLSLEEDIENELLVYPNPTHNSIIIPATYQITAYSVSDQTGKLIISGEGNVKDIDVSALQPGIFILELRRLDNTPRRVKFIKK